MPAEDKKARRTTPKPAAQHPWKLDPRGRGITPRERPRGSARWDNECPNRQDRSYERDGTAHK